MPVHYGPWQTVYWWFRHFVRRLLFQTLHDVALMLAREQAGREANPSAAVHRDFVIEIVRKLGDQQGFQVLPRRWVVERTFGWMTGWPCLVRDYERRVDVSEAMIRVSMGALLLRRIAHPGPFLNRHLDVGRAKPVCRATERASTRSKLGYCSPLLQVSLALK